MGAQRFLSGLEKTYAKLREHDLNQELYSLMGLRPIRESGRKALTR